MSITFKSTTKTLTPEASNTRLTKQRGHVTPRNPVININGPGRLRSAHVLALCGFSHSTLYTRMENKIFPRPDGQDGGRNYWNTQTIKNYLENQSE